MWLFKFLYTRMQFGLGFNYFVFFLVSFLLHLGIIKSLAITIKNENYYINKATSITVYAQDSRLTWHSILRTTNKRTGYNSCNQRRRQIEVTLGTTKSNSNSKDYYKRTYMRTSKYDCYIDLAAVKNMFLFFFLFSSSNIFSFHMYVKSFIAH